MRWFRLSSFCSTSTDLRHLTRLSRLRKLVFDSCLSLRDASSLSPLTALSSLQVLVLGQSYTELPVLSLLSSLTSLVRLELNGPSMEVSMTTYFCFKSDSSSSLSLRFDSHSYFQPFSLALSSSLSSQDDLKWVESLTNLTKFRSVGGLFDTGRFASLPRLQFLAPPMFLPLIDNDVRLMTCMTNLTSLSLADAVITDEALVSTLRVLSKLRALNLTRSTIRDETLPALTSLPFLSSLNLGECVRLSGANFSCLLFCTSLTQLYLFRSTWLRDHHFGIISCLTNLRSLVLSDCRLSNSSARCLSTLTRLETLALHTPLSGLMVGLEYISHLTSLRKLVLRAPLNEELRHIAGLTGLCTLEIFASTFVSVPVEPVPMDCTPLTALTQLTWLLLADVTASSLSVLSHLTTLRILSLYATFPVSYLEPLPRRMPNLSVLEVRNPALGPEDLPVLAQFTQVRELDLGGCSGLHDTAVTRAARKVKRRGQAALRVLWTPSGLRLSVGPRGNLYS